LVDGVWVPTSVSCVNLAELQLETEVLGGGGFSTVHRARYKYVLYVFTS
jgi:hypothetical protein